MIVIGLSHVNICVQRYGPDAARRAGPSVEGGTCFNHICTF